MRIFLFSFFLLLMSCGSKDTQIKVLQLNIWHEGRSVEGGFEAIVVQIKESKADIVMFSEINNAENTRFCDRILEALAAEGLTFYSFYSTDTGILSRFPIKTHNEIFNMGNNINRAVIEIGKREIALYSAHLDYKYCSYYLVKGYDGNTYEKLYKPVTDVDSILRDNILSNREDAIKVFLAEAQKDIEQGRLIILGGDFNEPSHADWTDETKDLYGRNGLVIPWTVSKMLTESKFVDSYRQTYPNPVTHPGFTYPAYCNVDIKALAWAPEADERERIDFIYYYPSNEIALNDICIWGPNMSVCKSKVVKEETLDVFKSGSGIWPSDHKGVFATFTIGNK